MSDLKAKWVLLSYSLVLRTAAVSKILFKSSKAMHVSRERYYRFCRLAVQAVYTLEAVRILNYSIRTVDHSYLDT